MPRGVNVFHYGRYFSSHGVDEKHNSRQVILLFQQQQVELKIHPLLFRGEQRERERRVILFLVTYFNVLIILLRLSRIFFFSEMPEFASYRRDPLLMPVVF